VKRSQRGTETEAGDGDEGAFKCGAETGEDCGVFARPLFHRTGVSSLWRTLGVGCRKGGQVSRQGKKKSKSEVDEGRPSEKYNIEGGS
jgi:hypothetical protein